MKLRIETMMVLAEELSREGRIPFPGIDSESYPRLKSAEAEDQGYTTPIDEWIERCRIEGIKVVPGRNPDSGNVYILPAQSTDIENDGLLCRHLLISAQMNEKLQTLVHLSRG